MPHIHSKSRKPAIAVLLLALAALALAACGSSSTNSSSTAATSADASSSTAPGSSTTGAPAGRSGRFAAVRECLKKNGITLPEHKPGQRPGAGGFYGGAGSSRLPAGVSRSQFEAAMKKCGGGFKPGRYPGAGNRYESPAAKQALAKFASCMRENGVNVPAANTSGKGPIFSTKGLNTNSATFKSALSKCRSDLTGAFRARPDAAGEPEVPSSTTTTG
ncbi:MAG TPA: hypothetical protein VMF09_08795 [Solirubrobacteraceae bacterium]|nr:hypothetical protein [Solirubrobacteraceae bacterium]